MEKQELSVSREGPEETSKAHVDVERIVEIRQRSLPTARIEYRAYPVDNVSEPLTAKHRNISLGIKSLGSEAAPVLGLASFPAEPLWYSTELLNIVFTFEPLATGS